MTWQKRHDIILNWVHSCKTYDQLLNITKYVKCQDFDTSDLLGFCRIKVHAIHAGIIVNELNRIVDDVKSLR